MDCIMHTQGFPCGLEGKESACDSGDPGLILGWGRSLGEEDGSVKRCCSVMSETL